MIKEEILNNVQDVLSNIYDIKHKYLLSNEQYASNYDKKLFKQEMDDGGVNYSGNLTHLYDLVYSENGISFKVNDVTNKHIYHLHLNYNDSLLTIKYEFKENSKWMYEAIELEHYTKNDALIFIKEFLDTLKNWVHRSIELDDILSKKVDSNFVNKIIEKLKLNLQ